MPAAWREEYYTRQMEWFVHCSVAAPLAKVGRREEAASHARLGLELATRVGADTRGQSVAEMCSYMVADADHVLGNDAAAGALLESSIDHLAKRLAAPSPAISALIGEVACLQRLAVVRPADACTLARRAAEAWRSWQPRTRFLDARQAELDRAVAPACSTAAK
jgi:hypothetical protein